MKRHLPSFFIIGAQKAGTTSLHEWLVRQPDVCLPVIKETHFFSHEEKFRLGLDWYMRQFPSYRNGAVTGEVDPEYLFRAEAPLRIRRLMKSPKLLCVFRHPVERAYSHYLMSLRRGFETLSFVEALEAEDARMAEGSEKYLRDHSYMERGNYSEQVERFREAFPDSDFLFIKFEKLFGQNTCREEYSKICSFLGLGSEPIYPDSSAKSNQASVPRSRLLKDLIYGKSTAKKLIGSLIPSKDLKLRLAMIADRLNQAPAPKSDNWRELVPARFWKVASKEAQRLEMLTGLDLRDWRERREVPS